MDRRPAHISRRRPALRPVGLPALAVPVLAAALSVLAALLPVAVLKAHAALQRTEPAANAVLAEAPPSIDLWFNEPLEANYSKITLRDSAGSRVDAPPAAVDAADPYHLSLQPGDLPEGIYTVVWQVVSAADGHTTSGSFPLSIGATLEVAAITAPVAAVAVDETLPVGAAMVRWFNLLALTLGAGAVAFAVLVWQPAQLGPLPQAERRLRAVMLGGWLLMGIAGLLILWLQVAIATQAALWPPPAPADTAAYVQETRFGSLWLWRVVLWLAMGGLLFVRRSWAAWAALVCAAAILALTSLFSHAGASENPLGPVAADWLHLLMAAVWIGGLAQLAVVAGSLRAALPDPAAAAGNLVARFSNVARLAVLALVVSGAVALWLQAGSIDALLDTV